MGALFWIWVERLGFMGKLEVEELAAALRGMSPAALKSLIAAAKRELRAAETETCDRPACPKCGAGEPISWGHQCGSRRWRCRKCAAAYTAKSGTPLAWAKQPAALEAAAANMMSEAPLSVRKLAEEIGVHRMTVWRWRLKLLRPLLDLAHKKLTDLVEADETFFRESRKGSREWSLSARGIGPQPIRPRWRDFERHDENLPRGTSRWQAPILVLRSRQGGTVCRRLSSLRHKEFAAALDASMADAAMLFTDGAAVYRQWGKARGRIVEQINTKKGIRVRNGVIHIQNANAYHSRLKEFIRQFKGPSIRNLDLYIAWMAFRDGLRGKTDAGNPLLDMLAKDIRRIDPTWKRQEPHPPHGPSDPSCRERRQKP
jgi:transposase-like protein